MRKQKDCTVIIVPNSSSRLHKVRLPFFLMYLTAAIGCASLIAVVVLAVSYVRMVYEILDYGKVQAANTELKVERENLDVATKTLNRKLDELESRSHKITALLESDDTFKKPKNAGMGGSRTDYSTVDIVHDADDIEAMKNRVADLEEQVSLLEQKATKRSVLLQFTPSIWPVKGRISSPFGDRIDPFGGDTGEVHLGLDISGAYGSPVHSPADGLVIYASRMSDYGNLLIIDHGNGITTRLGHLSRFQAGVGRSVRKGEIVGYVGMTGRTTGPHLHYEVRLHDRPVNPKSYLPADRNEVQRQAARRKAH